MKYLTSCNWDVEQAVNLSFAGALDFPAQSQPEPQGFGSPQDSVYQQVNSNATGMPLFTSDQMTYHRYMQNKEEYKSQMVDDTKSALDFMDFVNAHKTSDLRVDFEIGCIDDDRFSFSNQNTQPMLLFILPNQIDAASQSWIDQILCSPHIGDLINKSFKTFGVLSNSNFLMRILKFLEGKQLPCMMVLRKDQWDELLLVGGDRAFDGTNEYLKKTLTLSMILVKSKEVYLDESVVDRDFVARYVKRRRDRENFENKTNNPGGFTTAGNDMSDMAFDKMLVDRVEKERQDLVYEQAVIQDQVDEDDRLDKHKMQEEKLISENAAKEQKFDKKIKLGQMFAGMDEPATGEGVIECNFRTVSGGRIKRNFLVTDRLQMLVDWIFVEENSNPEDNTEFELLPGAKPDPLTDMEAKIGELFPGQKRTLFKVKAK